MAFFRDTSVFGFSSPVTSKFWQYIICSQVERALLFLAVGIVRSSKQFFSRKRRRNYSIAKQDGNADSHDTFYTFREKCSTALFQCMSLLPCEAHKRDRVENLYFQPRKPVLLFILVCNAGRRPGQTKLSKKVHFSRELFWKFLFIPRLCPTLHTNLDYRAGFQG